MGKHTTTTEQDALALFGECVIGNNYKVEGFDDPSKVARENMRNMVSFNAYTAKGKNMTVREAIALIPSGMLVSLVRSTEWERPANSYAHPFYSHDSWIFTKA